MMIVIYHLKCLGDHYLFSNIKTDILLYFLLFYHLVKNKFKLFRIDSLVDLVVLSSFIIDVLLQN